MSQVVQNENVTIELNGMDVCSIGTITLWCMTASVIFSQVAVPPSSFVSADIIKCLLGMYVKRRNLFIAILCYYHYY